MTEEQTSVDKSINVIRTIYDKYANDAYMLNRVHTYITEQLPTILENIQRNHEQRQQRIEELSIEQDIFIQTFLTNNQYFYIPSTENYFYYDGMHYHLYKEDDIIYNVLSSISRDRQLLSWKQKTKIYIMKRIKENNLLKSVPESVTIQNVLDILYPTLFSKKAEAKYFLTILGDNIFKKNTETVHFITANAKRFLLELNNICQMVIGSNLSQTFRHKYHEHDYVQCRLVNINDCVKNENIWGALLQNNTLLDIICVACHYSIRYVNSDDYIMNSSNESSLINKVFYLKNIQPEKLVENFIGEFLHVHASVDNTVEHQISWKNMQYLWKNYLDTKNLPMIMFQNTLKQLLIQKLDQRYVEATDIFMLVSSKRPEIQKFIAFWEDTIQYDECENYMEFEIDEICILFKKWCLQKNESLSCMNGKEILGLIAHYYPYAEIENDKFIFKIRSSMWDKQMDIQVALENMKEKYRRSDTNDRSSSPSLNISIYDAYVLYCKYFSSESNVHYHIVSKSYFEKYIFENLGEYVIDDKFISSEWIRNG